MDNYYLFSLPVVTVGFGRNVTQVNESDMTFMMCVVKDRVTTRPLQLQIQDQPNTALRSIGILSLIPRLSIGIGTGGTRGGGGGGPNPPSQIFGIASIRVATISTCSIDLAIG